ncbi:MAG: hypothetical protein IJP27_08615 [Clostridia bacterium]|nr:hypothetical protein [Clostridia bacterium]
MKIKNLITLLLCGVLVLGLSVWCFFGPKPDYSDSERRVLASFPKITLESVISGEFAGEFEEYATDRFPVRDLWRGLKAYTRLGLFQQKDNNKIFLKDGHLSKLEYPMKPEMADHALKLFEKVQGQYCKENKIYFAMIPDKNMTLADLKLDYAAFESYMAEGMPYAENISLRDLLTAEDYYFTDTHWRQDHIVDVAERLAEKMGATLSGSYESVKVEAPFYGVYAGQSAMHCKPDAITYLTNPTIAGLQVEGAKAVYDLSKVESKDPYELFLSGNQPVVKVTNPQKPDGKRLILFRDSFGSSVAPLLAEGYSEITLVDLRYINSSLLDQFVNFENADVLFLYSTVLLNESLAMK